jgi:glycosyltransferase involved in cell wall biosynthesis
MSRSVAFDLSRLFVGPLTPTPRGIDRVDLAFGRHFFEQWDGDCVGTLPTPWGIRWFTRDRSLRVINFIEDYWRETERALTDPAYAWVKARLRGKKPPVALNRDTRSGARRLLTGFSSFARQHGLSLGSRIGSLAKGAVYLNTGQIVLAVPSLLGWLARRQDVRGVFMMQDVIPIDFPEYCSPQAAKLHRQMLATIAHHGTGLILTTRAAEQAIRRELAFLGCTDIATIAELLPVPSAFLKATAPDPELLDVAYFVVSGSIEPRKNHLLLLNIWRELVRTDGAASPKLVVVGSRHSISDAVRDMLERCEAIKDCVIEVEGLSTPGLRQLLAGARALLMPSFAEGFGIPIVEALALGTPVIASDLACHQEAGGAAATYLSPIDGLGWLAAIRNHAGEGQVAARARAKSFRPLTWADYFRKVQPFIVSA